MPPVFSREIQKPSTSTTCSKFHTRTSPFEAVRPAGNLTEKIQDPVRETEYGKTLELLGGESLSPDIVAAAVLDIMPMLIYKKTSWHVMREFHVRWPRGLKFKPVTQAIPWHQ